ncbi:MAG: AmmeMemoRadiSam system protein B [Candidatus Omnitrophica bacterium]|nr:AmmeMemoRadiSam system protein B [Candidatus Omnitrophota bacterium]
MGRTLSTVLSVLLLGASLCAGPRCLAAELRTPKVAGSFYPAGSEALRQTVDGLLGQESAQGPSAPVILISPHAGYSFSGPVAAFAFRQVRGRAADYDAVVVVGFLHRAFFSGSSVDDREAYQTPLGDIPVDREAAAFLRAQPGIDHVEEAHESGEHSLEVMLPFLQASLGRFRLVPVLMGGASLNDAAALAKALAGLAAHGRYLFVFSTDLSHYHPYEEARRLDELTINTVLFETPQAAARLFGDGQLEACGRGPILTSLLLAERLGYPERRLLHYANSGDTAGDKSKVVGYAAIGMYPRPAADPANLISPAAGQALVQAARTALAAKFGGSATPPASLGQYHELAQPRGLFVTLRKADGELRGCVGRIQSDAPLATLLPTVALDAALRDSRFPPVTAEELGRLSVEVSVLTTPQPVSSAAEIVAGRDGVVLQKDGHGGVFLPQVWEETGWTRLEFLRELAHQKAGLDPEAWRQAGLLIFQAQAFEEESPSLGVSTPH